MQAKNCKYYVLQPNFWLKRMQLILFHAGIQIKETVSNNFARK